MDVFYLLAPHSWSALWKDGQGRPSVNTLFTSCVCVRARVCVTFWLLSRLWPRFLGQRTSGPVLPSHLPQRCVRTPALASPTGGVATVMDDRALGFRVRVLHPCYLPGGALSKTSCWASCFCRLFCSLSASGTGEK